MQVRPDLRHSRLQGISEAASGIKLPTAVPVALR